ncbi:maleylpyruvate isomerase N-terminal domain-containing protein [Streptomyces zhihengii]
METTEYIDTLRREGELLADAAERAGEHAPVPTCPGWTTGDLVRHTSTFHRWAARIVAGSLPGPVPEDPAPGVPTGTDLWPWFRDGHAALLRTLEAAARRPTAGPSCPAHRRPDVLGAAAGPRDGGAPGGRRVRPQR